MPGDLNHRTAERSQKSRDRFSNQRPRSEPAGNEIIMNSAKHRSGPENGYANVHKELTIIIVVVVVVIGSCPVLYPMFAYPLMMLMSDSSTNIFEETWWYLVSHF